MNPQNGGARFPQVEDTRGAGPALEGAEGEEEEGEEERDAAKALAASAPREVLLPSVHPYPLEPCVKGNYCDVRGPGCKYSPTVYSSVECDWDICQVTLTLIYLRQARIRARATLGKCSVAGPYGR